MANDKTTEWATEILGDGADSAHGTFVRSEPRQGDIVSDRLDSRAALDQEEVEEADVDAGAERQTVSPGQERGAADQQRTDEGHGYAGQGAQGQPGTP